MRHKDGHEIKIAHRALSPKMRVELEGLQQDKPKMMAEGGEASPSLMDKVKSYASDKEDVDDTKGIIPVSSPVDLAVGAIGAGIPSMMSAAPELLGNEAGVLAPGGITTSAPAQAAEEAIANSNAVSKAAQQGGATAQEQAMAQQARSRAIDQAERHIKQKATMRPNFDEGGEAQSLAKLAPLLLAMAKGGQVKDPTQEHLLPGDAIPNKIEEQVVNQAKQHYADGSDGFVSRGTPDKDGNFPKKATTKVLDTEQTKKVSDYFAGQPKPRPSPQAYADGGDVEQQQTPDPQTNGAPQTPEQAPAQDQPQQQAQVPAETQVRRNLYNEQVKNMALNFPESATDSDKSRMIKAQQFGPNGEPPEHFNTQAATASSQRADDANKAAISANKASIVQANANNDALAKLGLPPQPVPQDMSPQSSDLNNIQQNVALANQNQQPAQPAIKDPYGMDQAYNQWQTGMKQRLQGINAEAMATGKMGTNQAEALQQGINTQQALDTNYTDQINKMNQERQHVLHDLDNQHIDANRYINNMSTGDRIRSSIGLILGGFGAVAGQGNMAYQTLQNNIIRDIDAQKANMSKSQNMLANNLAQFGNVRDAATWHQVMSNDIIAKQVQQQAAKMAPGLAQARAQQLVGQLNQDSSQKVAEMGMRRALMGAAQGNPSSPQFLQMLRVMNPEMAKEMEGRLVPNGGPNGEPAYAQVPVPQPVRDNILGKQTLDARAKDLYQWASQHSGELSPSERNIGQTKAAELQSMYRNAINGGVFKKGEQEYIDKIISSDPAEFFNSIRVLPQLKTIIGSNAAQLNAVKQSIGLPVAQGTAPGGSYKNPTFKKVR